MAKIPKVVIEHLTLANPNHYGQIQFYKNKKGEDAIRVALRVGQEDFVTYRPYYEGVVINKGEKSKDGTLEFADVVLPATWKFFLMDGWKQTDIYMSANEITIMRKTWYENHKPGAIPSMTDEEYDDLFHCMLKQRTKK